MLVPTGDVESQHPGKGIWASSNLIRLAGLVAILGGVAWVALWSAGGLLGKLLRPLGVLSENMFFADNIVFVALFLGVAAVVAALYVLHRRRYGWVGTLAAFATLAALLMLTVFVVAGYGAEGPAGDPFPILLNFFLSTGLLLTSVGLLALGIATIRAKVLPWWCGVALIVGSPPAGIGLSSFMWVAGNAALVPVGIAWILVGYAVLRANTTPRISSG